MKKILMVFAVSTFFLACKNKGNDGIETQKNMVLTDTSLLRRSGLLSDTGALTSSPQNLTGTTTTSSTTTTTTTTTTTGNPVNKVVTPRSAAPKRAATRSSTASRSRSTSLGNNTS